VNCDDPVGTLDLDKHCRLHVDATGREVLTLDVPSRQQRLKALSGDQAITAPLSLAKDTTFTTHAGSTLTVTNLLAQNVEINKEGSGTWSGNRVHDVSTWVSRRNAGRAADASARQYGFLLTSGGK